jgi:hypothetical protein
VEYPVSKVIWMGSRPLVLVMSRMWGEQAAMLLGDLGQLDDFFHTCEVG